MELPQPESQMCILCHPLLKEQKILVKTALKALIGKKKKINRIWPLSEEGPLLALQKTLNLQTKSQRSGKTRCRHLKLQRVLQKTGYSLPEINSACLNLERSFAERSYHLWLVQSQIKNVVGSLETAQQCAQSSQLPQIPTIKVQQLNSQEQSLPQVEGQNIIPLNVSATSADCSSSAKIEQGLEASPYNSFPQRNIAVVMSNMGILYPLSYLCPSSF